jgi:hypothetical protein
MIVRVCDGTADSTFQRRILEPSGCQLSNANTLVVTYRRDRRPDSGDDGSEPSARH